MISLLFLIIFCLLPVDAEAAQLAISAVGAGIGFLFGGPFGAALGWTLGSIVGGLIFPPEGPVTKGPRLKDLHVQSAAHGSPMKRFFGVDRMAGQLVWVGSNGKGGRGIREKKHEVTQGKGGMGGGGSSITYTYDVDCAISINASSNCKGVIRIWAGPKLIYDVSENASLQTLIGSGSKLKGKKGTVTFYDGNELQTPPAIIEALAGVGQTSAYRNQFLAVFTKFRLGDYGNQIPQFSFECFTDGESGPEAMAFIDTVGFSAGWMTSDYVDPNGEIVSLVADPFQGAEATAHYSTPAYYWKRVLADGTIIPEPKISGGEADTHILHLIAGHSDEPTAGAFSIDGFHMFRINQGAEVFSPAPSGHLGPTHYIFKDGVIARITGAIIGGGTDSFVEADESGIVFRTSSFLLSVDPYIDFDASSEFYYFLLRNSGTLNNSLLKVSRDTLAIVSNQSLSTTGLQALVVVDDEEIYFAHKTSNEGPVNLYRLNATGDGLDLVGTTGNLSVLIGFRTQLLYSNGIFYYGNHREGKWVIALQAAGNCVPLWQIVRDICIADGLEESDIDVTDLTDCVEGYTIDQQMSGRDAIKPLQMAFFFDAREHDLKIQFYKRGHQAVATIPEADMAARSSLDDPLPPTVETIRAEETELPWLVHVRFKDMNASYQTGHAYQARLTTESKHTVTVDIPVVMDANKGEQIAQVLGANLWLERSPKEVRLSRQYMRLDAADPVNLEVEATA